MNDKIISQILQGESNPSFRWRRNRHWLRSERLEASDTDDWYQFEADSDTCATTCYRCFFCNDRPTFLCSVIVFSVRVLSHLSHPGVTKSSCNTRSLILIALAELVSRTQPTSPVLRATVVAMNHAIADKAPAPQPAKTC